MQTKPTLWLRAEHKPQEARVSVTPAVAQRLVSAGFEVVVERSAQRAIALQEYLDVGCVAVNEHSWRQAPEDVIVIGLKELPVEFGPFVHRHIHFAHVYKQQHGWQSFLQAFNRDGGTLFDLEYLVDPSGRRVAAFGYWAGFVGAALSILAWSKQSRSETLSQLQPWPNQTQLVDEVNQALTQAINHADRKPTALVIGALGRSGLGACDLFSQCAVSVTRWDQRETARGGPFDEILTHDLLVNCVYLNQPVAAFTHLQHLQAAERRLSVITDVSCDPYSELNPLPIYNRCTNMGEPTLRILDAAGAEAPALDLISIDHLPSLLPIESSHEFSEALAEHLLTLDQLDSGVWGRASETFLSKSAEAASGVTQ